MRWRHTIGRQLLRSACMASTILLAAAVLLCLRSFWTCSAVRFEQVRPDLERPQIVYWALALNRGIVSVARDRAYLSLLAFESELQVMQLPSARWHHGPSLSAEEHHGLQTRFGFGSATLRRSDDLGSYQRVICAVPLWPAMLLLGSLSCSDLVCLMALLRRVRRSRSGLCLECGYDLRASPARCPECGSVPSAALVVHWPLSLLRACGALAIVLGGAVALWTWGGSRMRQQGNIVRHERGRIAQARELVAAVERGDSAAVANALKCGVSANVTDGLGRTALYLAVEGEQNAIARLLLAHGATADSLDAAPSPLHEAVRHANFEMVRSLLAHDASPRASRGVLNVAVAGLPPQQCEAMVELLCSSGADVNAGDADGDTPLHVAAIMNNVACVRVLMSLGADPGITNRNGQRPRDLAMERGHVEIAELLDAGRIERGRQ